MHESLLLLDLQTLRLELVKIIRTRGQMGQMAAGPGGEEDDVDRM